MSASMRYGPDDWRQFMLALADQLEEEPHIRVSALIRELLSTPAPHKPDGGDICFQEPFVGWALLTDEPEPTLSIRVFRSLVETRNYRDRMCPKNRIVRLVIGAEESA